MTTEPFPLTICQNIVCVTPYEAWRTHCPSCNCYNAKITTPMPPAQRVVMRTTWFTSDGDVHKRRPGRVHLKPAGDGMWKAIVTFDKRLRRPSRVTFGATADAAFDNMISWCDRVCTQTQRAMLRRRPNGRL